MNIYKISRSDLEYNHWNEIICELDTYDSAIVIAKDEKQARKMLPYDSNCKSCAEDGGWYTTKDLNKVIVTLIGTTSLHKGVVLSSFNAG